MNKSKRFIYITAVLLAVVLLTFYIFWNYTYLLIVFTSVTNPHAINVFFFKGTTPIQKLSITLYAFYPTSNGTVIEKIFTGKNLKHLTIPLSNLTNIAQHWIKHYNNTIEPSLIGFATYITKNNNNGTITTYTQPFTIEISPYNITHGIGKTEIKQFTHPLIKTININQKNNNQIKQNYISVTTTTPPYEIWEPYTIYVLNNVWYYPSNNSLGPFPLSAVYITDPNYYDYTGGLLLNLGSSSSSGVKISFGVSLFAGTVNIDVIGTSITLSSSSISELKTAYIGANNGVDSQFGEIYTYAQVAVANYTQYLYYYGMAFPMGTVDMVFVTGLLLNGSGNTYVPATFSTNSPTGWPGFPNSYGIPPTEFMELTSNNYTYLGEASGFGNSYMYNSVSYEYPTSYGYLGGSVPLSLLLKVASSLMNIKLPSWVSILISAGISITTFTNYASYTSSVLSITSLSQNTYYVYMLYSNVSYYIGSKSYYLPYYYYYVNYTS